ncbi:MAG: hypothetical protein COB22_00905 [Cycloclasticus sp.]|nr:MAG: hypothetical protein COB22_00905 [Cycloclasticus sp.]
MANHKKILLIISLIFCCEQAVAHGGVGMEDDLCIIKIGFLKAHFTGYQQTDNGSEEFCEDAPKVADSIFVVEYLHDFLKQMQVDFRIVRDINGVGKFASWEDIMNMQPLGQHTVYYLPPMRYPEGVLKANFKFQQAGDYIGVVTATHPEKAKIYHSVFYFKVGGFDDTYAMIMAGLALFALLLARMFGVSFFLRAFQRLTIVKKK